MVSVVLQLESSDLDEVIVVGYGTTKRKDFTGSVGSLNLETSPVALMPNLNALEALKGSVSGLNIGATNSAGGQPSMQIRGENSIDGNNAPLIVLDRSEEHTSELQSLMRITSAVFCVQKK